jgi:hypothetical protein
MAYLIVVVLIAAVAFVVSEPFRRRAPVLVNPDQADLEAARDAKLRELRDAELDHQTGKLSDRDFALVDGALRTEAVEILHALDRYHPDR